jgi:hypothetical protein
LTLSAHAHARPADYDFALAEMAINLDAAQRTRVG